MEGRIIEYSRPINGLDYHNSPLIGEIPTSDYTYYRSIDQLRTEQTITQPMQHHHVTAIVPTTDLRAIEFPPQVIQSEHQTKYVEDRTNNNSTPNPFSKSATPSKSRKRKNRNAPSTDNSYTATVAANNDTTTLQNNYQQQQHSHYTNSRNSISSPMDDSDDCRTKDSKVG